MDDLDKSTRGGFRASFGQCETRGPAFGVSWEFSAGEKFRTAFNPPIVVHREYVNCRSPRWSQTDDSRPNELKVVGPGIAAWMKERDNRSARRVKAGKVGSLMKVTAVAGQREICKLVHPTMLPRDDVLNVMQEAALFLTK
jgi:hypothetical protein